MPRVAPIDRSHFQPVPLLRMEPVFLPMPDFALRSVDSHVANKAEQRFEPKSNLVKTVWQQFPPQRPWPPMHPALRAFQNKALQIFREAPANFFITDEIFYDRVREQSVEFDKLRRWMARILHEKGVSDRKSVV